MHAANFAKLVLPPPSKESDVIRFRQCLHPMKLPTYCCPLCSNALPTENILQGRKANEARGRCQQCKRWVPIELPSVTKKLVYLDQSFLSAACLQADDPKSKKVLLLLSKIKNLKERQKIFVVVSDVHSRETSAIPDEHVENRRRLWKFQNDLANGNISTDWRDVFVAQQRRALVGHGDSESFPVIDIGLENPHRWQVGMKIQLTNHWRPKLDASSARPRPEVNDGFRQIIERQFDAIPRCTDLRDCLTFVRELWHKDIRQGITACQQRRDLMLSLEAGRVPDSSRFELPDATFRQVVGEVVRGPHEASMLDHWSKLMEGDSANLCTAARIRIAFEASLLWQWRTRTPPTNPKSFNEGFGISRQNDIDHVSAFVPYVDALTTDKNMLNLCRQDVVAGELERFPCKIFATTNYNDFEAWLDALLAESELPWTSGD